MVAIAALLVGGGGLAIFFINRSDDSSTTTDADSRSSATVQNSTLPSSAVDDSSDPDSSPSGAEVPSTESAPTTSAAAAAPPPPPIDYFGAIAISRTTADVGYAINMRDQASANNAAMSQCGQSTCEIVASFRNACGAVAQSPVNLYWGWSSNGSKQVAINEAIGQVQGPDPKVITAQCTDNALP
ncbi:DUF4189 domain-containing protein [Williamsia sp. CHRR-6]|uniref:DUF4189 domain-containing protein n=1 Tax=Williamsia sp. CHRR-6 TaxID=2835871 RepID=UPI001BD96288|nr:DUF4189 domain-containing protein [Williamsia sp. CHRR-6]MBT0565325.1 DUF4189 domain-containing protein [Williamsia sp. CHRR-6]